MFNEHVYRCSLNNKRTILYISAENQQANKLCKILSFHVRRFFWALCCALQNILLRTVQLEKETIGTTREFWIRSVVFMFQHAFKDACACLLKQMPRCMCESLNLIQKRRCAISIHIMNRRWTNKVWVDGRKKIVGNGGRNAISTGGCDNFTLINFYVLAT